MRYPACTAHAPYCHLRLARLYKNFPRYLINGTIFEKISYGKKVFVLVFSTTLFETFLILTRTERDVIKNIHWLACKVHVIFVRLQ